MSEEIDTVVFDLDQTLISTFPDHRVLPQLDILTNPDYSDIRDRCYVMSFFSSRTNKEEVYAGIERPHLQQLLAYVHDRYNTIVYTAGEEDYGHAVVRQIFPYEPEYIFTKYDCLHEGDEYSKPLKRLFELEPELKRLTSVERMVLVDDREENFKYNQPHQGILVEAYEPELTIAGLREPDDELMKLIDIFEERKIVGSEQFVR